MAWSLCPWTVCLPPRVATVFASFLAPLATFTLTHHPKPGSASARSRKFTHPSPYGLPTYSGYRMPATIVAGSVTVKQCSGEMRSSPTRATGDPTAGVEDCQSSQLSKVREISSIVVPDPRSRIRRSRAFGPSSGPALIRPRSSRSVSEPGKP